MPSNFLQHRLGGGIFLVGYLASVAASTFALMLYGLRDLTYGLFWTLPLLPYTVACAVPGFIMTVLAAAYFRLGGLSWCLIAGAANGVVAGFILEGFIGSMASLLPMAAAGSVGGTLYWIIVRPPRQA